MSDEWWFPLLAVAVACFGLIVTAGIASGIGALLRTRLSPDTRTAIGGAAIALVIACAIASFAYGLFFAEPGPPVDSDVECLGPPSSTC